MKEMVRLGIVLLVFSAISAGILGLTNEVTAPAIAEGRRAADLKNMQEVFPEADNFEAYSEEEIEGYKATAPELVELYKAKAGGNSVGYIAKVVTNGFHGDVELIVGFFDDGKINGLRLGQHSETPGLGANAATPEFYGQFSGLTLKEELSSVDSSPEGNQIQGITAATITSNAVVAGINGLANLLGGLK